MDNLTKTTDRIVALSKGFEKGDAYIPELIEKIQSLKDLMQQVLDEDSKKKALLKQDSSSS